MSPLPPCKLLQCTVVLRKIVKEDKEDFGDNDEDVAEAEFNLGQQLQQHGKYAKAEKSFKEASRIYEAVHGKDHAMVSKCISCMGEALSGMGRFDEAIAAHEECLRINRKMTGEGSTDVAGERVQLGNIFYKLGKNDKAMLLFEKALPIFKEAKHDHGVAICLHTMASIYQGRGETRKAIEVNLEAVAVKRGMGYTEGMVNSMLSIANCHIDLGEFERAREILEGTLKSYRMLNDKHPAICLVLNSLGQVLSSEKNHKEAAKVHKKVLEMRRKTLGPRHLDVGQSAMNAGMAIAEEAICAYYDRGDMSGALFFDPAVTIAVEEALPLMDEGLQIMEQHDVDSVFVADAYLNRAKMLHLRFDSRGALKSFKQCVKVLKKLGKPVPDNIAKLMRTEQKTVDEMKEDESIATMLQESRAAQIEAMEAALRAADITDP